MKKFLICCLCLVLWLSAAASAAGIQPYTVSLTEGTSVHTGPGKDYATALTLDEDGVFTIVEEALGTDSEFWGKLKSGAGWVQLTFRVNETPYTLALRAGTTVYNAPDHNSGTALTIDEDGVFTIIEEAYDLSGNAWGKLKSGAGWVALSITSYLMPLDAGTEIHEGPGYNFDIARTIDEKGVFTIVEEAWDDEGRIWGKLKSGAGWIFLRAEWMLSVAPIRAFYAEDVVLQHEPMHIIADTSEYAVDIVFLPNEDIRNIAFSSLTLTDYGFEANELLFSADELTTGTPLLASVAFPGDMSAYGLAFTDASGSFRRYTVSISGMDGSLELSEQC